MNLLQINKHLIVNLDFVAGARFDEAGPFVHLKGAGDAKFERIEKEDAVALWAWLTGKAKPATLEAGLKNT